jgi:hypothetical protein
MSKWCRHDKNDNVIKEYEVVDDSKHEADDNEVGEAQMMEGKVKVSRPR